MKLICWYCKKVVSSEIPDDTIFRAIAVCPECIKADKDTNQIDNTRKIGVTVIAEVC